MKKLILALLFAISGVGTAFAQTTTHRLHFCVTSPAGRSCQTRRIANPPHRHVAKVTHRQKGYRVLMEVTYYLDSGLMADGNHTYIGAAACGYDLRLGTLVSVPGVGLLRCEDRIGTNPWHHIDVFGYRPGLGNDYRYVTVFTN